MQSSINQLPFSTCAYLLLSQQSCYWIHSHVCHGHGMKCDICSCISLFLLPFCGTCTPGCSWHQNHCAASSQSTYSESLLVWQTCLFFELPLMLLPVSPTQTANPVESQQHWLCESFRDLATSTGYWTSKIIVGTTDSCLTGVGTQLGIETQLVDVNCSELLRIASVRFPR